MKKSVIILSLAFALACGGEEAENTAEEVAQAAENAAAEAEAAAEEATAEAGQAAEAAGDQVAAAGNAAAAVVDDGESNFGTLTLSPGFTPDPTTVAGTSGGSIDASTLDAACLGNVDDTPDHLFVAEAAFASLRIMAKSDSDTTLVIQRPDGTYTCNDDDQDLNPLVSGEFPAGTYKIWVGSYNEGENASYTLGLSELDSVSAANL